MKAAARARAVTFWGRARRLGVELLFRGRDPDGSIEVIEHAGVRYLHFGTHAHQSAHDLNAPRRLVLECTRRMAAALLLAPGPRRALVLGLGGGALARHLLELAPACSVVAVERRALVVELARRYFELPDDPRLRVHIGDALPIAESLARETARPGFDVIFVDLFHGHGADESILGTRLFGACSAMLREGGVLASNYWSRDMPPLGSPGNVISASFPAAARLHSVEGNRVLFGMRTWPHREVPARLLDRARRLTRRSGVDYTGLLNALIDHNPQRFGLCAGARAGRSLDARDAGARCEPRR